MRLEGLKRGAYTIDRPRWITTEEALEAWSASLDANVAPLTKRRLLLQTRRFLSAWDDLPWLLDREDVWGYAELYSQGCRNFCTASSPGAGPGCREGLDIGSCATSCPKYQSMAYETVGAHLQAVSNFFRFLEHHGVVKFNVAESVKKEWLHQNKHRKRVKEHRVPALADVQKLLSGQPNHALVYLLMAKTGPRVGEAMSLRVDFEHFERGRWFKVPGDEGKRRGNRYLFLDQELDAAVEKYLVWRRNVMLNCGQEHDFLFIGVQGKPLAQGRHSSSSVNRFLRQDLERLGLPLFTAHGFRHFFSTIIKQNGIDGYWWDVLRGDVPKGTQNTYIHATKDDIRGQFLANCPVIGGA